MSSQIALVKWQEDSARPLYSFDLAGALVLSPDPWAELGPDQWPDGSSIISEGEFDDIVNTRPRRSHLLRLVGQLFGGSATGALGQCYPGGVPIQRNYFFFPRGVAGLGMTDEELLAVISVIEGSPPSDPDAVAAEALLRENGVSRIPGLTKFHPAYHSAATALNSGTPITIMSDGWVRDGRPIKRAIVTCDSNR